MLEKWESVGLVCIFTGYMASEDMKRPLLGESRDESFSSLPSP